MPRQARPYLFKPATGRLRSLWAEITPAATINMRIGCRLVCQRTSFKVNLYTYTLLPYYWPPPTVNIYCGDIHFKIQMKRTAKQRQASRARSLLCYLAVSRLKVSSDEIAWKLNVAPSTVSKCIYRGQSDEMSKKVEKNLFDWWSVCDDRKCRMRISNWQTSIC